MTLPAQLLLAIAWAGLGNCAVWWFARSEPRSATFIASTALQIIIAAVLAVSHP